MMDRYFDGELPDAREALAPKVPKSSEAIERETRQRRREKRIYAIHIGGGRYTTLPARDGIPLYAMFGYCAGLIAMAGLSAIPVVGPLVGVLPWAVVFLVIPFLVGFLCHRKWPD